MWSPLLLLLACGTPEPAPPPPPKATPEVVTPEPKAEKHAFANSPTTPPPDWKGPVFELSDDYPTKAPPPCTPKSCPWLGVDVDWGTPASAPDWNNGKWADYMQAMKTYIRQGQDDGMTGLKVNVDGKTRWYHVPWMAYDPTVGRDFVHGTTNERTAYLSDLTNDDSATDGLAPGLVTDSCQTTWASGFETWAVGVYNPYGGWAIGQAIPRTGANAGVPQTTSSNGRALLSGLPFPNGTLVTKFLTTNAPPDCVPYLKGSPEWQIDRHVRKDDGTYTCERKVQTSRIVQVDVAVVDERSPSRWVYGTYVYNGTLPGNTFWDRLQPLGAQWGSDHGAWPTVPKDKGGPIVQTVLNPAVNIYEHEGCNERLAGPVDNKMSSCISCHGGGFAPPVGTVAVMGTNEPPIFGFTGMCEPDTPEQYAQNSAYFHDSPYPQPYADPKYASTIPLDTSLQMQVALSQYANFATNGKPNECTKGN